MKIELESSHPILWRELAKSIPGRSDKECRKRWWNNLVGSSASRGSSVPVEEEEEEGQSNSSVRSMPNNDRDWDRSATTVGTRSADHRSMRWDSISSSDISYDDRRMEKVRSPAPKQLHHDGFEERASADTFISSTRKRKRRNDTRTQALSGNGIAGNYKDGEVEGREGDAANQYHSLSWGRKEDTNDQTTNFAFPAVMKNSSRNSRRPSDNLSSYTDEPTEQQNFWAGQNGTASPPDQSDFGGQHWMDEMLEQIMDDQAVPPLCFGESLLGSTPSNSDWDSNMVFEIQGKFDSPAVLNITEPFGRY